MAKEKVQKNKQRSTKNTYKTKNRVTRTPLKSDKKYISDKPCQRRLLRG